MIAILKNFFGFCTENNRKKFYKTLWIGVLMAVFNGLKYPAIGLILQGFFDNTISYKTILAGFLILVFSVAAECLARAYSTMLQCRAGYGECANKRIEIAEHLRFLPMGYFNQNSLGKITSVTTNTMENLGDVATKVVMLTTQGMLNTAITVLLIFIFDWRIGTICLVGVAFFALVNHSMQKMTEKISSKKIESDTSLVAEILEYIQGITEIKAYNMTGSSRKKLNDTIIRASQTNIDMEMAANRYIPLQNIILKLTEVAVMIFAIKFYLDGNMELLMTILMMIMSFLVFAGLESMGAYSALLRTVNLCVEKGQEILNIRPMDISGREYATNTYNIDVKEIDFSYDEKKIIDHVTLNIPEKTTAAFVGPSGSGKTTMCHLIARFWDVQKGEISLDDKNVKRYSMDSLMDNYSFVFQNVYLFHDTIANNIRFGQPDAPMSEVIDAAKKACCHEFIMKLPEGYDTVIGENGVSLSGGEKQRISIARAIMKDAPVIILDEATANVDPENEKELMEAVKTLTNEKTILMIAHRLKTVRNADQIFVVDKGRIVQHGTHEQLLEEEGIYRRFVDSRKQAIGWKLGGF